MICIGILDKGFARRLYIQS